MESITTRFKQSISLNRLTPFWCNACVKLVSMISVEEAAMLASISTEAMLHQIESRHLHVMRASTGVSFICLCSLATKR
jgi:hypothetical protein